MEKKQLARLKMIALITVFIGPLIAASWWYYSLDPDYRPASMSNHGKLVDPVKSLSEFNNRRMNGTAITLKEMNGIWTMLYPIRQPCADTCKKVLYNMHQVRIALGRDMSRVQRMIMLEPGYLDETAHRELMRDDALIKAVYGDGGLFPQLDAVANEMQIPANSILIVDPLGNLMMAFPPDLDPRLMLKDLKKLLKLSQIG